jgi:hypothetical protein
MRMNFQEVLLLFLCHQINNVKTILIVCSVLLSISVVGNCAGAPVLLKLELLKTASSTAPSSAQVSNLEQILLRISWNPKDLTQDETSAIRSGSGLKLTARDTNSGGTKPVSFTIIGSGHEPTTGFIELSALIPLEDREKKELVAKIIAEMEREMLAGKTSDASKRYYAENRAAVRKSVESDIVQNAIGKFSISGGLELGEQVKRLIAIEPLFVQVINRGSHLERLKRKVKDPAHN